MNKQIAETLVQKAVAGDKQAYAEICELVIHDVLYVCIKLTGDLHHGEDAAQEALIKLGASIKKLKDPAAFPLWLSRCITNSCKDYIKKEKRQTAHFSEAIMEDFLETDLEFLPEEWAEKREMRQLVITSLRQLPARQQRMLLMYYFEGLSLREIAQANKTSEDAARSGLYYARGTLRRRIEHNTGHSVSSLPALSAIPTLTVIFNRDAALIVTEESSRKVLLAVGASLAGGAATVAVGTQIAAVVSGVAPVVVALAVAAAVTLGSSPSPSQPPADGLGVSPQYAQPASEPDEGEGDLYIESEPYSLPQSRSANTPPPPVPDNAVEGTASVSSFVAQGSVVLSNGTTTVSCDLSGLLVEAYREDTLVASAFTDIDGRYTLCLPDDTVAYTLWLGETPKPNLGTQSIHVLLAPGRTVIPTITVRDNAPPECGLVFLDERGEDTATNPAAVQINVSDVLPCTIQWAVFSHGDNAPLLEGEGQWVDVQSLPTQSTGYFIEVSVTDLAGNNTRLQCEFYIQ